MKPAMFGRSKSQIHLMRAISRIFVKMRVLWVMLLAALLLSGCVQYDLGVNFEGQHRGEIVQRIKLGEQLTSFSGTTTQEWLNSIEHRARQLQGKTQRVSPQEIIVKIPFANGKELEEKFNQFFNPTAKNGSQPTNGAVAGLPEIQSHLSVKQNNFLLWVRNTLIYDLDLRSLGVISSNGNLIVSSGSIIDLDFSLRTPGGARNIAISGNAITPVASERGRQLVWKIQPGKVNHIEAVFWLSSPLAFGAVFIALFVWVGIFLKERMFPDGLIKRKSPAVPEAQ